MRIAIVSDIHGNLTALEAVLADLRETAPDLVLHGGDLADNGSAPAETLDRIRALGWRGVFGNTDEMLFAPETLKAFADAQQSGLRPVFAAVEAIADFTRPELGAERLTWLSRLAALEMEGPVALVHASPGDTWRAPGPEAADADLEATFARLEKPVVVYGHIHRPFVRRVGEMLVVNSGSVSLAYDGDPRASYLLIEEAKEGATATIRRVAYDVELESRRMVERGTPHAEWVAAMLRCGRFQMP
jgi:predicted phosphodiesterase